MTRDCDHKRGESRRSTAITVCRSCRDYLCSTCGVTIDWHAEIYVTNPPVQWRYCSKTACIEREAAYHALSVDEMIQNRAALRAKRVLVHLQDRGIEPRIRPAYLPRLTPGQGRLIDDIRQHVVPETNVPAPEHRTIVPIVPRDTASVPPSITQRPERVPFRPERVFIAPQPFVLDPGEACWCNRGKDCNGTHHEIGPIEVVNVCGMCGQTFQISNDDPHWSTGRGPICPPKYGA